MQSPSRKLALVAVALFSPWMHAQQHPAYGSATPLPDLIVNTGGAPNDRHAMKQHYVVLVSLDGFRYDYPEEHGATHLQQLAEGGARAYNGMLPSYPSLTFPNHWTLVTGLLPEHHGIVRNSFYDPVRKQTYEYKNSAENSDGSWYGGTPLWALAEQQGMRSAVFMWPGSEAEVAGRRPDSYAKFEDQLDGHVGIDQIVAWLKLPAEQRPHFIAFYLPTTDHAGHWYGPDSVQETQAVHTVDGLIGDLRQRLDETGLPVDLVVVADHGMILNDNHWIQWDQYADLSHTRVVDWSLYLESEAETEKVYEQFKAHPDPALQRLPAERCAPAPAVQRERPRGRSGACAQRPVHRPSACRQAARRCGRPRLRSHKAHGHEGGLYRQRAGHPQGRVAAGVPQCGCLQLHRKAAGSEARRERWRTGTAQAGTEEVGIRPVKLLHL